MADGNTIRSVAKAMDVLTLLGRSAGALSLKAITEQTGIPKSTAFGLLATMRDYDMVAQQADGRYTLGLGVFELGCRVSRSWDISAVARPYMEHLAEEVRASAMLSICEGRSVMTIDQVEARDDLRVVSDTGARLPLHCTSQGKIFLAAMDAQQARRVLSQQELTAFTPHTMTDAEQLLQQLEQIRADGYAVENGEYKIGLRSISAPVRRVDGTVQYTVGVIGMFRSVHGAEFEAAIAAVRRAGEMISAALGWRG